MVSEDGTTLRHRDRQIRRGQRSPDVLRRAVPRCTNDMKLLDAAIKQPCHHRSMASHKGSRSAPVTGFSVMKCLASWVGAAALVWVPLRWHPVRPTNDACLIWMARWPGSTILEGVNKVRRDARLGVRLLPKRKIWRRVVREALQAYLLVQPKVPRQFRSETLKPAQPSSAEQLGLLTTKNQKRRK